jgi:hypothetical protein
MPGFLFSKFFVNFSAIHFPGKGSVVGFSGDRVVSLAATACCAGGTVKR